jgi:hypothetical protein
MIHIMCRRKSTGALHLAREICRLAGKSATACRNRGEFRVAEGDFVVNWGESVRPDGLNARAGISKRSEMILFKEKNVPTLELALERPADPEGWLGRAASHHEGNDLLTPTNRPAFWTRYENLEQEFRVHIFKRGAEWSSVRLGAKFPRPGVSVHPWVRSWVGGWHLLYNAEALALAKRYRGVRDAAKAAVEARGLDFGAVDIGVKARDQRPIVLEVNTAPGLEGRTLEVYAREVMRYAGVAAVV